MPCLSPEAAEELANKSEVARLKRHNNVLTDMLCRAGRNYYAGKDLPEDIIDWMVEHCEYDKERGEAWDIEPTKSGVYMSVDIALKKIDNLMKEIEAEKIKVQYCFGNNASLLAQLAELQKDIGSLPRASN